MANIILVRHGQDTDNEAGILNGHRDTDLTSLGRTQAKEVARKLEDDAIDIVLHSPLKRTAQTAHIIAEELGVVNINAEPLLIERDFGVMTGKAVADIAMLTDRVLVTEKITYFLEVEGAEDFPTLYTRARKFLALVQQRYPNSNLLAVTHGDIGKMIQAAYHGWSWEDALKGPYFANTGVLHLSSTDVVE